MSVMEVLIAKNCAIYLNRQKWNQHVLKMPENRLPRKLLQYQPQGKIYLGRPYRRWKDQFM